MTEARVLGEQIRRLRAPNPSPMTHTGTNTYLLGTSEIAVIDPGPDNPAHLAAILAALGPGQRISHILVTHSHLDHSPLARPLAAATGAPVLAFGDSNAGRSAVMRGLLAQAGAIGGGEGIDSSFVPDVRLADGDEIGAAGWRLRALHVPGHFGNHLAFAFEAQGVVFTGDHVMGWASSLVSPPDGDLTDFMASLERLLARPDDRCYLPGHGEPVDTPHARVAFLRDHRREREASILRELGRKAADASSLAKRIYDDVPPALLPAAARNVFAHLIDLTNRKKIFPEGNLGFRTLFRYR